ncbi:MAG: type transporter [Chloroflexi bacterium]|nr:type transporter [Chloroflexota bacterium]
MSRLLHMTIANLKMTVRARQALFWNLAFPLIILVLLSVVFGSGGNIKVTVGVVGNGPVANATRNALAHINGVTVKTGSESGERAALKNGDRDAVLVIPPGTPAPGHPLPISLYYDQTNLSQSSVVVSLVSQVMQGVNQGITHTPQMLVLRQQGIATVSTRYIDFLLPGIIGLSIMTSGVIGISSRMVGYREQRILKRLRATPLKTWEFVASNVISQLVVVLAQVLILTAVATTLFGVHIAGSVGTMILLALLGGLAFLTIGFAISGFASTADAASALGNVVTMPMMFLSGVYFPLSAAPEWLKPIISLLPLTYLANGLRDVMNKGVSINTLGLDFVALAVTAVLGFGVAARTFRWE